MKETAQQKETALNEALRAYQIEKPNTKFYNWCMRTGLIHKFSDEEVKEAKLISKTLRV